MRRIMEFKAFARRKVISLANFVGYEVANRGSNARSIQTSLDTSIRLGLNPFTVIVVGVAHGTSELYSNALTL